MFSSREILYPNILILFSLITSILCDCQISLPEDSDVRPSYYKHIGRHRLKINTSKYTDNVLKLYEHQEIEAHCSSNFEIPEHYKMSNTIYMKCKARNIYTSTDIYHNINTNYFQWNRNFECSRLIWHLYESSDNFHWCPANVTSYILARPLLGADRNHDTYFFNYLAGICYDVYNSSIHSIYYTLAPNEVEREEIPILRDSYRPGIIIKYIKETFGFNSISANVYESEEFKYWISAVMYEFNSMIQHEKLHNTYITEFASLLEFLWWPNLLVHNWKYYIKALEQHVESEKKTYDILAGVSGAVKVPIKKNCQHNYTMEEVTFNMNRKIPLYVWNYMQDRSNTTNGMVIIGFNSPFYEIDSQDEIIFCRDRCQEISWLKNISSSFHYNIMGIVFCCNVEDVRLSKVLYGFPENDIKPMSVEIAEERSTLNEEETEINDEVINE